MRNSQTVSGSIFEIRQRRASAVTCGTMPSSFEHLVSRSKRLPFGSRHRRSTRAGRASSASTSGSASRRAATPSPSTWSCLERRRRLPSPSARRVTHSSGTFALAEGRCACASHAPMLAFFVLVDRLRLRRAAGVRDRGLLLPRQRGRGSRCARRRRRGSRSPKAIGALRNLVYILNDDTVVLLGAAGSTAGGAARLPVPRCTELRVLAPPRPSARGRLVGRRSQCAAPRRQRPVRAGGRPRSGDGVRADRAVPDARGHRAARPRGKVHNGRAVLPLLASTPHRRIHPLARNAPFGGTGATRSASRSSARATRLERVRAVGVPWRVRRSTSQFAGAAPSAPSCARRCAPRALFRAHGTRGPHLPALSGAVARARRYSPLDVGAPRARASTSTRRPGGPRDRRGAAHRRDKPTGDALMRDRLGVLLSIDPPQTPTLGSHRRPRRLDRDIFYSSDHGYHLGAGKLPMENSGSTRPTSRSRSGAAARGSRRSARRRRRARRGHRHCTHLLHLAGAACQIRRPEPRRRRSARATRRRQRGIAKTRGLYLFARGAGMAGDRTTHCRGRGAIRPSRRDWRLPLARDPWSDLGADLRPVEQVADCDQRPQAAARGSRRTGRPFVSGTRRSGSTSSTSRPSSLDASTAHNETASARRRDGAWRAELAREFARRGHHGRDTDCS